MPEQTDDKKIFSLREVTASIQKTLAGRYTTSFWVKAEMNKLNFYPHSGHCYPDLVEKSNGRIVAQMKSTLWRDDYLRINSTFLRLVQAPLKDGITVLLCARITFDPLHGLALRILDIDAVFSLGELEREKQESITRLQEGGMFGRNKSLPFPLVPKRLAIISVQTSKGYADFLKMINENPWGYKFFHLLFPSLLQGDNAVDTLRFQLGRIRKASQHFDVVAIIRGGGGEVGLSCFNDYQLCRDIALFPIPVITGIGHATNETVAEMVAHRNAITPTELADFLLQQFHNFSMPVQRAEEIVVRKARAIIADQQLALRQSVKYFRAITGGVLNHSRQEVRHRARDLFRFSNLALLREDQRRTLQVQRLRTVSLSVFERAREIVGRLDIVLRKQSPKFLGDERSRLQQVEKSVDNMDPRNVLKRGFSITRLHGKTVTHASQVAVADALETILSDGIIVSQVTATTNPPDNE